MHTRQMMNACLHIEHNGRGRGDTSCMPCIRFLQICVPQSAELMASILHDNYLRCISTHTVSLCLTSLTWSYATCTCNIKENTCWNKRLFYFIAAFINFISHVMM